MTKVPSEGTEGIVQFMGINGNSAGEVPWRIGKINIYIYILGGFSLKKGFLRKLVKACERE